MHVFHSFYTFPHDAMTTNSTNTAFGIQQLHLSLRFYILHILHGAPILNQSTHTSPASVMRLIVGDFKASAALD